MNGMIISIAIGIITLLVLVVLYVVFLLIHAKSKEEVISGIRNYLRGEQQKLDYEPWQNDKRSKYSYWRRIKSLQIIAGFSGISFGLFALTFIGWQIAVKETRSEIWIALFPVVFMLMAYLIFVYMGERASVHHTHTFDEIISGYVFILFPLVPKKGFLEIATGIPNPRFLGSEIILAGLRWLKQERQVDVKILANIPEASKITDEKKREAYEGVLKKLYEYNLHENFFHIPIEMEKHYCVSNLFVKIQGKHKAWWQDESWENEAVQISSKSYFASPVLRSKKAREFDDRIKEAKPFRFALSPI